MKKVLLLAGLLASMSASAEILRVIGEGIEITPKVVFEDKPKNNKNQLGFNEKQGVLLESVLKLDNNQAVDVNGNLIGETSVKAGTYVDSHLIFLNSKGNKKATKKATWTFSGEVLGVMADINGKNLFATNDLFAVEGKHDYFSKKGETPQTITDSLGTGLGIKNLGLENNDSFTIANGYSPIIMAIEGTVLDLKLRVTEPGDWIRVITAAKVSAVPLPASAFLFGPAVLGFIARRRMKK